MERCPCRSCISFEQVSGMTRLWCSRTIRRHLKKQRALVASSVPLVNSPSLAIGNSLSVPPANSSPISPPNYDANSSPISAPNYDAQNELPCELDDEPGEAQAGLPSRGRPRRDLDFANQPLGSLLLDMRDKFPNMTEGVIDAQFALHNANKALGVDRDITGPQARRMHARRTKDMVEVFRLCHNQCSIQYGLLQDAISCPKCDAPYDGGCVYIFDMETKIFDLLRSYSWPEICPPPDSNVTRSFIDSPRCREVLSLMPGHPNYRVLVSASFDGGAMETRNECRPLALFAANLEHSNRIQEQTRQSCPRTFGGCVPKKLQRSFRASHGCVPQVVDTGGVGQRPSTSRVHWKHYLPR